MKTNNTIVRIALASLLALPLTSQLQAVTKSLTVGDSVFGATLSGTVDHAAWDDRFQFYLGARADANVLSRRLPLAGGESTIHVAGASHTYAWGNIKALGITVFTWNEEFGNSASFKSPPLYKTGAGGSKGFSLGPVDIKLTAKAHLKVWAEGNLITSDGSGGAPRIRASLGPVAEAQAKAELDLGWVGVEGSLKLCNSKLSGAVDIYKYDGYTGANVYFSASIDTGAPSGKLKVFADTWLGRYSKTVFSYTGTSKHIPLAGASVWID